MQQDRGAPGPGGGASAGHRWVRGAGPDRERIIEPVTSRPPRSPVREVPPAGGRVAVVTGGDHGLGLRIVGDLAARGMRVVMASRSAAEGQAAVDGLGELADRVAVRHLDITDPASVARLALAVRVLLGRCDVLVNNAVVPHGDAGGVATADLAVVDRALLSNLLGTWRMTRAVVPLMRAHRYGRIVNVAGFPAGSGAVARRSPALRIWTEGVHGLTRVLAGELASDGILVNAYRPDLVLPDAGRSRFAAPVDIPVWLATLPDDEPTGGCYPDRVTGRR